MKTLVSWFEGVETPGGVIPHTFQSLLREKGEVFFGRVNFEQEGRRHVHQLLGELFVRGIICGRHGAFDMLSLWTD